MTVIRPNSIAGINSITVQSGQALNIHDASGNIIRNLTSSSGVSTYQGLHVGAGTTNNTQGLSIGVGASIVQNTANELHFFTSGTNHFAINNEGQLTCQGDGSLIHLSKSGSDATETTAYFYTSNSGTHNKVQIKTSTNNGGDPYIQFDGGGQDMIVGERYVGTTNNLLVLGPGSNPDTTTGIFVKGTGIVGINTDDFGHADADELTLAGTRTGITIRSADDNYGNIFFSDATSGTGEYVGGVQYYHADNTLRLKTNSNDRLILNKEGDVNISGVCTATSFSGIVGGLTPISATTISSSTSAVSFTEALTGAFDTYKIYVVTMAGVRCDADDRDMRLRVRHGSNGGTLYANSDYVAMTNGAESADSLFSAADFARLNYNNIGNLDVGGYVKEDFNMVLYMYNFENNKRFRYSGTTTYMSSDGTLRGQYINGAITDATEVTGVEFYWSSSSNFLLGKVSLFGVNG